MSLNRSAATRASPFVSTFLLLTLTTLIATFAISDLASAATTPKLDNSNSCPIIGKTAKGIERRPCRPGSTHKIAIGVDKKYSPQVGVRSKCLSSEQEAQYIKDKGATCTVEYCTPVTGGKEKCTTKTVNAGSGSYTDISPYIQQAQTDSSRIAAYTAMTDVGDAHRTGNTARVQEIANLTKLNPAVNSIINNEFANIRPAAGASGNAASTLSDLDKINAVIASLDPQLSDAKQPPKDRAPSLNDSIAVDITIEKPPKDTASVPCPSSAPCDSQQKTPVPASTFSSTADANKKTVTQPASQGTWWDSVTKKVSDKVSDFLPAPVNRFLGLTDTPTFRPYDPNADAPLLVNEKNATSISDQIHLNPFDPKSPVVVMNKDVSISSEETALQSTTKRQTQAVQSADIDPNTPIPSGGIVVTPLGTDGKPDAAASQVMECNTWRCFLNEVKSNDKYNDTVISVNIPNQEKKTEPSPAGVDVVTTNFDDLPASVKEVFQRQDAPNKIAPPKVADNPPPGTDSPTLASTPPAGNPQNETPKESPAPPVPQPPMTTVEQSSPPVPTPLPEPMILPPAPPEKEEQPPAPPKEPQKVEEQKTEDQPVQPPIPVLSSPTKSEEQVPAPSPLPQPELVDKLPSPEPELKDKLPTPESTTQSSKEEIEDCKGNIDCRLRVVRKWLDDLERPKEPPRESSVTTPSSPSSRSSQSSLSSSYPRYVPGESSESYQKKVDAWWEQSNSQSLEDFINSRGGRVGQCESCHNPQMGGGAGPTTDYKGIGIRIQYERKEVDGNALPGGMILSVFPNTPAEQAGLRAGDFLLTLDGGKTSMISGIKGEPGTSIKVRYLPQGATTPKTVTVTRAIIKCSIYGCP